MPPSGPFAYGGMPPGVPPPGVMADPPPLMPGGPPAPFTFPHLDLSRRASPPKYEFKSLGGQSIGDQIRKHFTSPGMQIPDIPVGLGDAIRDEFHSDGAQEIYVGHHAPKKVTNRHVVPPENKKHKSKSKLIQMNPVGFANDPAAIPGPGAFDGPPSYTTAQAIAPAVNVDVPLFVAESQPVEGDLAYDTTILPQGDAQVAAAQEQVERAEDDVDWQKQKLLESKRAAARTKQHIAQEEERKAIDEERKLAEQHRIRRMREGGPEDNAIQPHEGQAAHDKYDGQSYCCTPPLQFASC